MSSYGKTTKQVTLNDIDRSDYVLPCFQSRTHCSLSFPISRHVANHFSEDTKSYISMISSSKHYSFISKILVSYILNQTDKFVYQLICFSATPDCLSLCGSELFDVRPNVGLRLWWMRVSLGSLATPYWIRDFSDRIISQSWCFSEHRAPHPPHLSPFPGSILCGIIPGCSRSLW